MGHAFPPDAKLGELFSSMLRTYPGGGGSMQLLFCAKLINLVLCHIAVITADVFQYNPFRPQYRIWGSTIMQLLDAFFNGVL